MMSMESIQGSDNHDWTIERATWVAMLWDNLIKAQDRVKQHADKKWSERTLEAGDWVYLKVQPYKQVIVTIRSNLKLSTKYYEPYQVEEKVGAVSYKLKLPVGSLIYLVFHISQLKKRIGGVVPQAELPLTRAEGEVLAQPLAALDKRLIKRNNNVVV